MIPALKTTKNRIRRLIAIPVAALIAMTAMGASFTAPVAVAAQADEQATSVDSPSMLIDDIWHWGLTQAVKRGLASKVNQSVTRNGVTITVKEILFNEAELSIGYTVHVAEGQQRPRSSGTIMIWIGGENYIENSISSKEIDSQTTAHIVSLPNMGQFPNEFELKLQEFRSFEQTSQSLPDQWELTIPIKKDTRETTVLKPLRTMSSGDTTYTVKEIAITPSGTAVKFELEMAKSMRDGLHGPLMELEDEEGMKHSSLNLKEIGRAKPTEKGYLIECVYHFSTLLTVPESIKIKFVNAKFLFEYQLKVETYKTTVDYKPTAENPIMLNTSKSKAKITNISYGKDKTEVHYQGDSPYTFDLSLEDGSGEEFLSRKMRLVDPKTYAFVAEFPALPPDAKVTIVNTERHGGSSYVPELEMTIPVNLKKYDGSNESADKKGESSSSSKKEEPHGHAGTTDNRTV